MNKKKILDILLDEETKVVSFDIFNTLIFRPVTRPTDLFKIVNHRINFNNSFLHMRMAAKHCARTNKPYYY